MRDEMGSYAQKGSRGGLPRRPKSPRLRSEDESSAQRPRGPEVPPLRHE